MEKKINYLFYVMGLAFMLLCNVNAESCPLEQRTALSAMANNISVTYEEVTNSKYDENGVPFFDYSLDVKIYNMNSQMRMVVTNNQYNDQHNITYEDMDGKGIITLRQKDASQKTTYTFKVYGTSTDCYGKLLRTINLTLPKFNYFSQYTLCEDISEFYMCQKYVMYDFGELEFLNGVEEYQKKIQAQENELNGDGEIKDNTSVISKVAKKVSDNKFLVAGVIIAVGVVVTIIVVIKKKGSDL
ncbi:MAG: hypothetical protein IJ475_00155 [Bacilli bacterium]|nr:hypothetical protein [Bacilli bacterium]